MSEEPSSDSPGEHQRGASPPLSKPVARAALIAVSAAFNQGLALLAWGRPAAYFSDPARAVLTASLFALCIAAYFAGGNLSPGVREDRANRWVIPVLGVLGLLNIYFSPFTEREGFWMLDGNAIRWLGVVLFTVGGALRLWPVFVLGPRFSGLVAIQPGHALVTTGIFRTIRNPSYLGLMISSVGWSLAFRSAVGLLLTALLLVPLFARIRSEEGLLAAHFGEEYAAYRARTWRLMPGIY